MNWDFDGFQKVFDEVWQVIKENHKCWANTKDKKNFQMMFYAQGQGTGKSRTLAEISKMEQLINKVKELGFTDTLHINITFDNATGPTGEDHVNKLDYLTYRILFHLIGDQVTGSNVDQFSVFCTKCKHSKSFLEVLDTVALKFAESPKKVAVFLMIDSIQKLGDGSVENDPLRVLIRNLSEMCLSSSVFIIPVISATQHIPLANAVQEGQTNYKFMETPPLSDIPRRNGEHVFPDTPANRALYNLTYKHPRTVESLEAVLNKGDTTDNLKETAEKVLSLVGKNYSVIEELAVEPQNKLICLAITKTRVNHSTTVVKGKELDYYLKMGLMDLHNNELRLSPFWLCLVAKPLLGGSLLTGWDWHASIFGESWELFTSWYRCLLSKVHPQARIKLKDLHSGMQFTKGGDIEVVNSPLTFKQSETQLGTKRSETQTSTKLIKNGKGAKCGDFFCTLSQVDSKGNINEVTQCHTQEFVGPNENPSLAGTKLNKLEEDRKRSCDDNDVFVLMTNKRTLNLKTNEQSWKSDMKEKLFGVVDYESMDNYFGSFAPFWRPIMKKEYLLAESLELVESSLTTTSSSVSGTLTCRYCGATTNARGEQFLSDWSLKCHENRCPNKQDEDEE